MNLVQDVPCFHRYQPYGPAFNWRVLHTFPGSHTACHIVTLSCAEEYSLPRRSQCRNPAEAKKNLVDMHPLHNIVLYFVRSYEID